MNNLNLDTVVTLREELQHSPEVTPDAVGEEEMLEPHSPLRGGLSYDDTAVELKDDQEIKQSRFELDGTLREGADVYAWWEPHHGVAIHDASESEVQS